MVRSGDNLPTGFLGPVKGWSSLLPSCEQHTRLQLPRDGERLRSSSEEPSLEFVEVRALTESMGRVEDVFARVAAGLCEGGAALVDVDNVQSARMLRMVVEGRPGCFDPSGSSRDPNQALPLRRVLTAAAGAGLLVRDVLGVPTGAQEFGANLADKLFGTGLLPLEWLGGTPPARFWLQCERTRSLAGSVVIAGDDRQARLRTETALRAFLPDDWEIVPVCTDAVGECAQWNRAIAAARGDVLWFLRAGMQPTEKAFQALSTRAGVGPAAPAPDGVREANGDIAGMMLPRGDVLFVGPLPEHIANTPVALEDYSMRLDSKLPAPWLVDTHLPIEPPRVEDPQSFEREADELLARWSTVERSGPADVATSRTPKTAAVTDEQPRGAADKSPNAPSAPPWVGRAPRITLCMIARDEERFLGECLARMREDAFDDFVLVDTGSTDRTVEIAESFGATVIRIARGTDDFSAPRNAGLREATGDWILVLDADEFMQPGGLRAHPRARREPDGARLPPALHQQLRRRQDAGRDDGAAVPQPAGHRVPERHPRAGHAEPAAHRRPARASCC